MDLKDDSEATAVSRKPQVNWANSNPDMLPKLELVPISKYFITLPKDLRPSMMPSCDEVIAHHVVTVPPAGFDALGFREPAQAAIVMRHAANFSQTQWTLEQP